MVGNALQQQQRSPTLLPALHALMAAYPPIIVAVLSQSTAPSRTARKRRGFPSPICTVPQFPVPIEPGNGITKVAARR
jgi:hypothetical protein